MMKVDRSVQVPLRQFKLVLEVVPNVPTVIVKPSLFCSLLLARQLFRYYLGCLNSVAALVELDPLAVLWCDRYRLLTAFARLWFSHKPANRFDHPLLERRKLFQNFVQFYPAGERLHEVLKAWDSDKP